MSKYDDRPYRVGKGKPPAEHRWKKGQSGNPRGRPRKRTRRRSVLRELLIEIANQEIEVTIGGKAVVLTKKEALLAAIINDTLAGTPAHRLKAFRALDAAGAFDVLPEDMMPDRDQMRRLLEELAEKARRSGAYDVAGSTPDG